MTDRLFHFNGVGTNGKYLLPPLDARALARLAMAERIPADLLRWIVQWDREYALEDRRRKPILLTDRPWDLSETGWGIVFGPKADAPTRSAFEPLIRHRGDQVRRASYLRPLEYKQGQTMDEFLRENGAHRSMTADPDRLPFYLLLVGGPDSVPYSFQYELDVQYAVGRVCFKTTDEYRDYVWSVVNAEDGHLAAGRWNRARQAAFFGVRHDDDPATQHTADELVAPLCSDVTEPDSGWQITRVLGEDAKKQRLAQLLGGPETPAVLFTASHGLGLALGDDRQAERQGALVCDDWRGPASEEPVQDAHCFAAADVAEQASLHGLVAFLYGCYSGGTPERDNFAVGQILGKPERIASSPFVARLPQRLLANPGGGALAVIGHIDRAWTTSFEGSPEGEGRDVFRACLRALLEGHTIGYAMQFFNHSYASLATQLNTCWQAEEWREDTGNPERLGKLWMLNNDARNFVLLGDPAVRLPGAGTPRPVRD